MDRKVEEMLGLRKVEAIRANNQSAEVELQSERLRRAFEGDFPAVDERGIVNARRMEALRLEENAKLRGMLSSSEDYLNVSSGGLLPALSRFLQILHNPRLFFHHQAGH